MLTSAPEFHLVPYIPQEALLSGLQPIYFGACTQQTTFWLLKISPRSSASTPSQPTPTLQSAGKLQANTQTPSSSEASNLQPALCTSTNINSIFSTQPPPNTTCPCTTIPVHCSCGHSTRKQFACNDQPGSRKTRCPCFNGGLKCNNLCSCRNCQNQSKTNTDMQRPNAMTPQSNPPPLALPHYTPMKTTSSSAKVAADSIMSVCTAPPQTAYTHCHCGEGVQREIACSDEPGHRRSRCPCLKAGSACTPHCHCKKCNNPHGICPHITTATLPEPNQKCPPPIANHHYTQKRKAAVFLADQGLLPKTGPHSSLEYFLMLIIVESEFGLLDTDALPREELLELYVATAATITSVTPHLPIYSMTTSRTGSTSQY